MRAQQRVDEFVVPRLVDSGDWVADHERAVCYVCSRPFGTFRRKHHCRMVRSLPGTWRGEEEGG